MKIALITGGRSDCNALTMVERALKEAGHDTWAVAAVRGRSPIDARDATSVVTDSIEFVVGSIVLTRGDLAIVHGDRHEILGAVVAANIMGVPVAHIGGGDVTEGSQDDCFRHAITKLSHLHFAANQDSADRIIQMGEEPDRVHVTGCPGIDMVMATPTLGLHETFAAVGLDLVNLNRDRYVAQGHRRTLLVLFHPDTLGGTTPSQLKSLSDALMSRTEALVLLGPNADAGGRAISAMWKDLAQGRPDTVYRDNVEPKLFYSLLRWCDVLVGNSSAGFYEAPCFGTRVIDIGDRQKGRPVPSNVARRCRPEDISRTIQLALDATDHVWNGAPVSNLYGDGRASERIAKVIGEIKDPRALLRKQFQDCRS